MADNYTENSELVRERATEDLFNRDAAPKHSQEHEAEELGSGLEGRASEELFLQSILEGSRDENSFSSGDERETAFEVKGVDHPLTEEGGIGTEGNSASDPVADAFSFSSLREGITEENSGFDLTPNTLSESVSDPESGFGDFSDSGMRQAHPVQQASPLEVEQTSVDAPVLADSELINKAAEARVPSTNGPQKESEINYQPSDITIDAAGIVEGAEGGTLVAVITGIDPNPGETLTYSIDNDPSGIFELVGNQLFLKEGANIDYEESQTHSVALKVTDTAGNSFVKVFYIEVEDINETPTLEVVSSVTVEEDGSKVISFNAVDVDAGDTVHTIASAANGTVTVDGNSGEITYTPDTNFNGSDTITVTTTDDDGTQVVKTVSVTVNDINDAPTLEVVSTATVDEDGSKTISFSAGDLDGTVSTTASAANGTVTVDGNSGEITYTPNADFNGADTITVTTTDDDGAQVVKTVSVTVNSVNDPVSIVTDSDAEANTVAENSANGTTVGITASAVDLDGETITYSVVDGSGNEITNGPFTVDATTGVVTVRDGSQLDYETASSHDIYIKASSSDGTSSTKQFTIDLTDINENSNPVANDDNRTDQSGSTLVTEDFSGDVSAWGNSVSSSNGKLIIQNDETADKTFDFGSEHANQTVTISFDLSGNGWESTGPYQDYFRITANGNQVANDSFGDGSSDISNSYSFQVQTDANGRVQLQLEFDASSNSEIAEISDFVITGGNDWSTMIGTDEDQSVTINSGTLLANDTDADGDSLTIISVQDAQHGSVVLDSDGNILFTPDAGYSGSAGFSYTVSDGQGGTSSATATVEVGAVADAPTLTVTLGNPSAVSGQDCSANGSYANWQASGVGMHAFTAGTGFVDAEGKLNLAAANGTVGDEPGRTAEGIGVVNSTPGGQASYQLEYGSGQSEALALDLNGPVSSAQVTLSRIYGSEGGAGEDARYSLFDADGNLVGSGSVDSSTLPNTGGQIDLTLTANTSFQYVVFTATGDNGYSGSDFKIKSIDYSIDADIEYPLEINAALNDLDGSETLSITVEGLPDGAVLSAGSDNGDGSWTLEGNQLNGLTLTVPENLSTGFDLTVSATATESDGGTAVSSSSVRIEPLNAIIGSTGDDLILGTNSGDLLDGAEGNDQLEGLEGDDILNGGQGSDHIEGGSGDDVISGGAGDDVAGGGDGNDTYIFNPFEGNDSFDGGSGGGWTDVIRLDANADPGADPDNPWTISIDGEQVQYDLAAHALELNPDTSGVITLSDGSELTFDGIERIEW